MVTEKIKSGYKRTEVGVIPEDWDVDEIQNHSRITTGAKNTQDRIDNGKFPFFVRSQKIERINTYSYDGEAVLTAGDGVGTGKVFHYINGKFDFHQRVYMISCFDNKLDGYFFYLYFSNYFLTRIMSMTAKSSVDSVRRDMIAKMMIPLPEKEEQLVIATTLRDMITLIEQLDNLIVKKNKVKQGTMQELLTEKKRLSGFDKDWNLKKFGDVLKIRHGKNQKDVVDVDGRYPILASGGEIGRSNSYLCDKPSVLIGRKGTIDNPQYVDIPFWSIDTLFFTEISSQVDPKFVFYLFNSINWVAYNEASGVPSLNASTIEKIERRFPSTKEEQSAIAQVLSDMDSEIKELVKKRDKYIQIKNGIMQQLLTGKIRLR